MRSCDGGPGIGNKAIWALTIGKYDADLPLTSELTRVERQLVLIGIPNRPESVDLEAALADVFERNARTEPLFRLYLEHYPRPWRLDRAR